MILKEEKEFEISLLLKVRVTPFGKSLKGRLVSCFCIKRFEAIV